MPLQNRVTPFGELMATPERGLFIGNRGIIHDPATRTLTGRRWTTKSWIVCTCDFRDRHRDVWATRSWTELFFLDEATALAAGHRPCFECRRTAARAFAEAWAIGNAAPLPRAAEMDRVLHAERVAKPGTLHRPLPLDLHRLPDGAMLSAANQAYLVNGAELLRWSFAGYAPVDYPVEPEALLTPPSTLAALAGGYRPELHSSARSPRLGR